MSPMVTKWACAVLFDQTGNDSFLGRARPVGLKDLVRALLPGSRNLLERHHDAGADAHMDWLVLRELYVRARRRTLACRPCVANQDALHACRSPRCGLRDALRSTTQSCCVYARPTARPNIVWFWHYLARVQSCAMGCLVNRSTELRSTTCVARRRRRTATLRAQRRACTTPCRLALAAGSNS